MTEAKVVRKDGNANDYFAGRSREGAAAEPGIWYDNLSEFDAVSALIGIMKPVVGEHLAELAARALYDKLAKVDGEALCSLLEKGVR